MTAVNVTELRQYLPGYLRQVQQGEEIVVTYIQEMPEVSRAIGEDVLPDIVNFLMAMASKTSGQGMQLTQSWWIPSLKVLPLFPYPRHAPQLAKSSPVTLVQPILPALWRF